MRRLCAIGVQGSGFALGPCGCLVVGSNFVRVDLHVVARCSCCGAVIVGGSCASVAKT